MGSQEISKILSIIIILLCFVLKIPQILKVKANGAQGINIFGLFLELTSLTIMTLYNICFEYALLSYMEYPVILIQQLILIYLVLSYMKLIDVRTIGGFGIYLAVIGGFITKKIPRNILSGLAPVCTPLSASSKIIQLVAIWRIRDSRSVSVLTWCISAFTNFARLVTTYLGSADPILLTNFSVSLCLSTSIVLSALYFKPRGDDDDDDDYDC